MEETDLTRSGDDDGESQTDGRLPASSLPRRCPGLSPGGPGALLQEPAESAPAAPAVPPGPAEHPVLLLPGPAGRKSQSRLLLLPGLLPAQSEEFHFVTQNR